MIKNLFYLSLFLVAIILMAIPGGDAQAQNGLQCPVGSSYTVQAGDWLSTIAVRYNVSTTRLAQINGITDPNAIRVGQVLCLTDWTTAGGVTTVPVADTRALPVMQPTTAPLYDLVQPPEIASANPTLGFNDGNLLAQDAKALDPAHRGVWEPIHWFLLIASIILVAYNLRVRWNGSKMDLIGAIASTGFAFMIVFVSASDHGHWVALAIYLTMIALSFLGDDEADFSSLGLMCLLTAIIASFFGKMRLLGIDSDISLRSMQDLPAMWATLDFSDMTLSAAIYGNLLAALLIFGRELWAELKVVGEAARDMSMPSNWNEFLGDLANAGLTLVLVLVWGFF